MNAAPITYLEDGHCSLSNNLSENSIRLVTVGRKNWLFSDTPEGASANAVYLAIVEMAKAYEPNLYESEIPVGASTGQGYVRRSVSQTDSLE